MSKIEDGMRDALNYATLHGHILSWIREDCPVGVKLMLHPEHVAKLIDRITGSKTHFVETD